MKNKFKLYGIIVLVAIIGFSMVSCNVGTSPIGNDDPTNPRTLYDKDGVGNGWRNVSNLDVSALDTPSGGLKGGAVDGSSNVPFSITFDPITLSDYKKVVIVTNDTLNWASVINGSADIREKPGEQGTKAIVNLSAATLSEIKVNLQSSKSDKSTIRIVKITLEK